MNPGDIVICAETGKKFTIERQGCTYNYAMDNEGNIFSDEGVDIIERRELLDHTRPFSGYLSSDGRNFTGWKGNFLGAVVDWKLCKLARLSYTHGRDYRSVRVRDVHGGMWFGRGSPGVYIKLRPAK